LGTLQAPLGPWPGINYYPCYCLTPGLPQLCQLHHRRQPGGMGKIKMVGFGEESLDDFVWKSLCFILFVFVWKLKIYSVKSMFTMV
jgi:hypothetical protein